MLNISTEVLASFLGKNATEISDALKDASEQKDIDSIIGNLLKEKATSVRTTAKKEGQGMAAKDILSKKQSEIAEKYGVDATGKIDDVIGRVVQSNGDKNTPASIRNSETYKNDLKALKDANDDLKKENEKIVRKAKDTSLDAHLDGLINKALENKDFTEFGREMFKSSLKNADWRFENDKWIPYKDNFVVKDDMQNDLDGESYVNSLANKGFKEKEARRENLPNPTGGGGEGGFVVPTFESREEEDKWYDNLDEKGKEDYLKFLDAQS